MPGYFRLINRGYSEGYLRGGVAYETPLDIFGGTDMKQWINYNRSSTQSGGLITYATDLSGNSADIEQGTVANQPTATAGGLNGKLVATFDGSTEYMTATSAASYFNFLHNGTNSTVWIVAKSGTVANPDTAYTVFGNGGASTTTRGATAFYDDRSSSTRNNQLRVNATKGTVGQSVISAGSDDSLTPNAFHFLRVELDCDDGTPANRCLRVIDGTAETRVNAEANGASASDASYVMNYGRTPVSGGLFYLDGDIAEIIILNRFATAGEITRIQTYFNNEWGL